MDTVRPDSPAGDTSQHLSKNRKTVKKKPHTADHSTVTNSNNLDMEPLQRDTAINIEYNGDISLYRPREDEKEKASYGYLMSIVALAIGLPLPVINLIATLIFHFANRRATYYVRWHCTQALLSQLTVFLVNSAAIWWAVNIYMTDKIITEEFVMYIIAAAILFIIELILSIVAAIRVRKGKHVEWWFWGEITNAIVSR